MNVTWQIQQKIAAYICMSRTKQPPTKGPIKTWRCDTIAYAFFIALCKSYGAGQKHQPRASFKCTPSE